MLGTIVWTIGIYSMAGHKEWRFIHPILPLLHVFAAKSLVDISGSGPEKKGKSKNSTKVTSLHPLLNKLPAIRPSFIALLLLTVPASIYIVIFYCSGPISVLSYIRSIPRAELENGAVGFLMPCHSTPGHAYLHREELTRGSMWALGCEPPLEYVLAQQPRTTLADNAVILQKTRSINLP